MQRHHVTCGAPSTSPNLEPRQGPGPGASEISMRKDEAEIAKEDETDSFWKTPIYLRWLDCRRQM